MQNITGKESGIMAGKIIVREGLGFSDIANL